MKILPALLILVLTLSAVSPVVAATSSQQPELEQPQRGDCRRD